MKGVTLLEERRRWDVFLDGELIGGVSVIRGWNEDGSDHWWPTHHDDGGHNDALRPEPDNRFTTRRAAVEALVGYHRARGAAA